MALQDSSRGYRSLSPYRPAGRYDAELDNWETSPYNWRTAQGRRWAQSVQPSAGGPNADRIDRKDTPS